MTTMSSVWSLPAVSEELNSVETYEEVKAPREYYEVSEELNSVETLDKKSCNEQP